MKKWLMISMVMVGACTYLSAQSSAPEFRVEVSTDSVLLGHYVVVSFTLENAEGGHFQAPAFQGFDILSGPSTASSFSMMNGEVSRSIRYTYYLKPRGLGDFFIQPASIEVEGQLLESNAVSIAVYPNPDGVEQQQEQPAKSPFPDWPFPMDLPSFNFGDDFFQFDPMPFDFRFDPGTPMPQDSIPSREKRKTYRI